MVIDKLEVVCQEMDEEESEKKMMKEKLEQIRKVKILLIQLIIMLCNTKLTLYNRK